MPIDDGTPFVVFGDDWGRYPSTMQHVFRHITSRYPVVWVNGIGHRVPRLNTTDIRRAFEKLRRVTLPVAASPAHDDALLGGGAPAVVIEPRVLPWHNLPTIHSLNTRSLLWAVRNTLRRLRLSRAPILVTGSPPTDKVVGNLGELVSAYYVLDDYLNFPTYTASMLAPLERRLLDRVDLVVATAASLTQSKRPRTGRAYHLPQGVNYAHFSTPRAMPADLAGIPGPRIGFAGSLSTQCDLEILHGLAKAFPEASLVLVGPIGLEPAVLDGVRAPNVHVLGVRKYEDLPAYVQHFDVGIIPYVLSAWTVAVDPLKLLEYLAAGLPVVTTAIPEAEKYAAQVAVAQSGDGFIDAVRRALAADRSAARTKAQAFAKEHTWERRADRLLEILDCVAAERRAVPAPATLDARQS